MKWSFDIKWINASQLFLGGVDNLISFWKDVANIFVDRVAMRKGGWNHNAEYYYWLLNVTIFTLYNPIQIIILLEFIQGDLYRYR